MYVMRTASGRFSPIWTRISGGSPAFLARRFRAAFRRFALLPIVSVSQRGSCRGIVWHRDSQRRGLAGLVLAQVQGHMRERDFNILLVKPLLGPAVDFAPDIPLLDRLGLDSRLDDHGRIGELIQSQDLD